MVEMKFNRKETEKKKNPKNTVHLGADVMRLCHTLQHTPHTPQCAGC
jgi:hypothetical protein